MYLKQSLIVTILLNFLMLTAGIMIKNVVHYRRVCFCIGDFTQSNTIQFYSSMHWGQLRQERVKEKSTSNGYHACMYMYQPFVNLNNLLYKAKVIINKYIIYYVLLQRY